MTLIDGPIMNDNLDNDQLQRGGDDYQLLLGVNRQSVSPLMQGPLSTPIQELVIGSHTTYGILKKNSQMVIII
jgi:hypothetical protein